jgi:hypothetical protein
MRYLFGFLCVCALGLVPSVGCDVLEGDCPGGCDDMNPCTYDQCTLFGCGNIPVADGTSCSPSGVCMDGVCVEPECWTNEDCDDGIACSMDFCSASYTCLHDTKFNGAYCDSGGRDSRCVAGECIEEFCDYSECDDGNECTFNYCSAPGVCDYVNEPDGTYCGCARWYWGSCPGVISGYCCADEKHCQHGVCF